MFCTKDNGNNGKFRQQSHSINSTWHMKTVGLFFSVPYDGSDRGSIGNDDNSCSAFDMNEDSNLTSINEVSNEDNEMDNSYVSNEDDDNDDDENDEENNEDDAGDEDTQNGFEGDESNLVPSFGR